MNDRFKSRWWVKPAKGHKGEMVYNVSMISFPKGEAAIISAEGGSFRESDAIELQSTGLRDKNGKLIFEGDLFLHKWYNDILGNLEDLYRISFGIHKQKHEFGEGQGVGFFVEIFHPKSSTWQETGDFISEFVTEEVIGNIYEHPNLLNP